MKILLVPSSFPTLLHVLQKLLAQRGRCWQSEEVLCEYRSCHLSLVMQAGFPQQVLMPNSCLLYCLPGNVMCVQALLTLKASDKRRHILQVSFPVENIFIYEWGINPDQFHRSHRCFYWKITLIQTGIEALYSCCVNPSSLLWIRFGNVFSRTFSLKILGEMKLRFVIVRQSFQDIFISVLWTTSQR